MSTVSSNTITTPEPSVVRDRARALEGERQVELVGGDEAAGRAAEQHRPQRSRRRSRRRPARAARAAWCRTAPRRCRAAATCARDAEQLGPRRALGTDRGVGRSALEHDRQHVDQRLDVVDHGRLAEQAALDRERRLVARLAAVALDRVEERRLLAADVRAGAVAQLDVERTPRPRMSSPSRPRVARLLDRVLEPALGERVLAAQVQVAVLAAGRERRRSSSPRPARTDRPP